MDISEPASIPFIGSVVPRVKALAGGEAEVWVGSIPFIGSGVPRVRKLNPAIPQTGLVQSPSSGQVFRELLCSDGMSSLVSEVQSPSSGQVFRESAWSVVLFLSLICFNPLHRELIQKFRSVGFKATRRSNIRKSIPFFTPQKVFRNSIWFFGQ